MKTSLIFLTLMILVTVASAQSAEEKEVAAAVESLRKAMVDGDGTALKELAAEELSYGHSNGKLEDKAAFVQAIVSGLNDFKSIDLSAQTIKISAGTAIVRHTFKAELINNGAPATANISVLQIWQKQTGKWKLIARQAVKL